MRDASYGTTGSPDAGNDGSRNAQTQHDQSMQQRRGRRRSLNQSVLAAHAVTDPGGDWSEGWAEVWKDAGAGFPPPEDHQLFERRNEVDQLVLANL